MTRERFTITFYFDRSRLKNGKGNLQCRVTFRGKSSTFSYGEKLPLKHWDARAKRFTGQSEEARRLNRILDQVVTGLSVSKDELLKERSAFSVSDVINRFRGDVAEEKYLLATYSQYIKEHKMPLVEIGKRSSTLLQKHLRTHELLKNYLKEVYEREDIDIRLIDYEFIARFNTFLMTNALLANNTAQKHIQRVREIYLYCLSNGWVSKDPFKQYRIKFEEVDRSFLMEEELKRIERYKPVSNAMEIIQDVFLFACYTGLSYGDIKGLKLSHISVNDGIPAIRLKRRKTNVESYVPLLPEAQALISKYQFYPERTIEGRVLPVRSNQKCNALLKVLLQCCGIDKDVTFHGSRHTFATNMITKGISIEAVSKMVRHKNIRTTQIYGRVLTAKVDNEMMMLLHRRNGNDNSGS